NLVDGHSRDGWRESGLERGLTGRRLARAALQHVPHDHFLDVFGGHLRALQCFADGYAAELGRAEGRKGAEEFTDGRAGGADDYWSTGFIGHWCFFLLVVRPAMKLIAPSTS